MEPHYRMLRQVSRTFALSIEQLPAALRDSVTMAYLIFRVSDCLEDHNALPAAEKAELLRIWARVLDGQEDAPALTRRLGHLDPADPEVYVAQQAHDVLEQINAFDPRLQQIIRQYARESAMGMARWQEHGPFVEDDAALDDYMHQVAGRVGYLLTDLFSWYSPYIAERRDDLMPLARECGLALQTVNIIRGLRKDYERGWVFVPKTYYEPLGLSRDSLFDPAYIETSLRVVERLALKAEGHLRGGLAYVRGVPRRFHRIRLACMWPVYFAVGTLAVSRNNANVLLSEAKIGRELIVKIVRDTRLFGWSNHWLRYYYGRIESLAGQGQSRLEAIATAVRG